MKKALQTYSNDRLKSRGPLEAVIDVRGRDVPAMPWMASIQELRVLMGDYTHRCGGSLIHERWVLTAGHCQIAEQPEQRWRIVLGRTNWKTLDGATLGEVGFGVSRVLRPDSFVSRPALEADLCLVELNRSASGFSTLPLINEAEADVAVDTDLSLRGYGGEGPFGGPNPVLRGGQARLHDMDACRDKYLSVEPQKTFGDDMICAGSPDQGACELDSGGPLLLLVGNVLKQFGVLSFSRRCGRPDGLGVHMRIANYLSWIRQHVPGV